MGETAQFHDDSLRSQTRLTQPRGKLLSRRDVKQLRKERTAAAEFDGLRSDRVKQTARRTARGHHTRHQGVGIQNYAHDQVRRDARSRRAACISASISSSDSVGNANPSSYSSAFPKRALAAARSSRAARDSTKSRTSACRCGGSFSSLSIKTGSIALMVISSTASSVIG